MPLCYQKHVNAECNIGIWEINEPLSELLGIAGISENETNWSNLYHQQRKKEFLVKRIVLQHLLKEKSITIMYDESGKPFLSESPVHISISHTKKYVGAITHTSKTVGIDIEVVTPRIEKISSRFIGVGEREWVAPVHYLEQLYVIWGAKECAFKIYSKGGIDFKKMLRVNKFDYSASGNTFVSLTKNNVTCEYPFWWQRIGELMLVYGNI